MVVASVVFYGWYDPRLAIWIVAATLVNHYAARLSAAWREKPGLRAWLIRFMVFANVAVLIWYKYAAWLLESVVNGLAGVGIRLGVPVPGILLPIGISFYVLQSISYQVDVYRDQVEPARYLRETMLFKLFFPQVVAGPIVRAHQFLPQLTVWPRPQRAIGPAVMLICAGIFKKVVVAGAIFSTTTATGAAPGAYSGGDVLLHLLGEAIRVYCDVSSYADFAVGLGMLLGLTLPFNFRKPFAAINMSDFWRRWHITLYTWLRDYIFLPLTGDKPTGYRLAVAALVTMTISGIWHGVGFGFVVWGALNGVVLVVEGVLRTRRIRARRPRKVGGWRRPLSAIYVMGMLVALGPLFAGRTLGQTLVTWKGVFHHWSWPITTITPLWFILVLSVYAAQFLPFGLHERFGAYFDKLHPVLQGLGIGLFLVGVSIISVPGVAPYLYYHF